MAAAAPKPVAPKLVVPKPVRLDEDYYEMISLAIRNAYPQFRDWYRLRGIVLTYLLDEEEMYGLFTCVDGDLTLMERLAWKMRTYKWTLREVLILFQVFAHTKVLTKATNKMIFLGMLIQDNGMDIRYIIQAAARDKDYKPPRPPVFLNRPCCY